MHNMGRKLDLQHLSEEECERILQVIQKDFELRQNEKERLSKVEDSLESEVQKTVILTRQESFNDQCCIRCCRTFGFIFNRKQTCLACRLNVCKHCSVYRDSHKGYICHMCIQSVDLEKQSCDWFYRSVRQRFKRFGSAKVVRSLYKRKSEKNKNEKQRPDSDTEAIFSQGLDLSGTSVKTRPALHDVFPHINLTGEELNLSSVNDNSDLPLPKAFSSPQVVTREDNSVKNKESYEALLQKAQQREDQETERFRKKFENALTELYRSLDNQTPSEIDYHGNKYGDFVTNYRNRFRDLLSNLSDSLQKIHNHANSQTDRSKSSGHIRQTLSKVVENAVGDTVDWGSDEAVSDLSSSTEEGNDIDTSYEDQLAQLLITKVVDRHQKVAEEKEKLRQKEREKERKKAELEKAKERQREIKAQEEALRQEEEKERQRVQEEEDNKNKFNYDDEFDKLIKFSQGSSSRPKPKPRELQEEKLAPVEEVPIVRVTKAKDESEMGLIDKVMSLEKLHDSHPKLPDFSTVSLGFNEVDPDLMSLSHSELEDNEAIDQDYLSEGGNSLGRKSIQSWQDNWILGLENGTHGKRSAVKRVKSDLSDSMYVHVPENFVSPRVGETDAEDLSDLSENEDKDSHSDEENAFYAQTSNEIERVSNRVHRTASITDSYVQTDDSDLDVSKSSLHLRGVKSRNSVDPALRLRLSESLDTSVQSDDSSVLSIQEKKEELKSSQKFQEMLIPSENDDPKFELPPESTTSPEGEAIKLVCRVSGSEAIDVFWYRADEEELREIDDCEKYDVSNDGSRHTVTIFNPTLADSGQYTCVALSEVGRCCQYFAIRVIENTQEFKVPEFMRGLEDIEVTEGRSAKFRCKVKGYPQPRVTWYKDGQRIPKSNKDYKIDKFGNRDYSLQIEYVTLDHDAEYTVKVANLAGECKQSAQLLVAEDKTDLIDNEDKIQRSAVNISTSNQKSKSAVGQKNRTKENQEIANLSQKMEMTRNDVSNAAEDMLSTAGELSLIHAELDAMNRALADMEEGLTNNNNNNNLICPHLTNHHALLGDTFTHQVIDDYNAMKTSAGNVRSVTTTAFDVIQSAENVIQQERASQNFTERRSLRDSFVKPEYTDNLTVDVKMKGVEREESKTSVDSGVFSIIGDDRNGFQRTSSGRFDSKRQGDSDNSLTGAEILSEGPPRNNRPQTIRTSVNLSANEILSSSEVPADIQLNLSEFAVSSPRETTPTDVRSNEEKITFGLKPVSDRYGRDYVIQKSEDESPRRKWDVNLNSYSPRAEVVNRNPKEAVDSTEENIYMTAGKVYSLEEKIGNLEQQVKTSENRSTADRLSDLEDEVARTVAQVAQSEQEVHRVETVVAQLKHKVPAGQQILPPKTGEVQQMGDKSYQKSSTVSNRPNERMNLVSSTKESDVPASQTEYDSEQYQLPSVSHLKNMFSHSGVESSGESAFRRESDLKAVHSITARSFNKQRLAEFRQRVRSSEADGGAQLEADFDSEIFDSTTSHDLGAKKKKYPAPQPPMGLSAPVSQAPSYYSTQQEPMNTDGGAIPKSSVNPKIKSGSIMARAAFWDKRIQEEITSDETVVEAFPSMLTDKRLRKQMTNSQRRESRSPNEK